MKNKPILTFAPAIAWALILLVLSLMPTRGIIDISLPKIPHLDKIAHLVMYALMGFFLSLGFSKQKMLNKKSILIKSSLWAALYGLCMEILQSMTSHRSFEWGDILANTMGALLGAWLYIFFFR